MKNVVLKVALGLSLASAAALAQGAFVGVEGDYSFGSKLTVKGDDGSNIKFTDLAVVSSISFYAKFNCIVFIDRVLSANSCT